MFGPLGLEFVPVQLSTSLLSEPGRHDAIDLTSRGRRTKILATSLLFAVTALRFLAVSIVSMLLVTSRAGGSSSAIAGSDLEELRLANENVLSVCIYAGHVEVESR